MDKLSSKQRIELRKVEKLDFHHGKDRNIVCWKIGWMPNSTQSFRTNIVESILPACRIFDLEVWTSQIDCISDLPDPLSVFIDRTDTFRHVFLLFKTTVEWISIEKEQDNIVIQSSRNKMALIRYRMQSERSNPRQKKKVFKIQTPIRNIRMEMIKETLGEQLKLGYCLLTANCQTFAMAILSRLDLV